MDIEDFPFGSSYKLIGILHQNLYLICILQTHMNNLFRLCDEFMYIANAMVDRLETFFHKLKSIG